uniref:Putative outer membrane protein CPn_1073/CP_0776/CPj1073/CpB1118 n=1 Tax=Chlamydia pneumoniae TaxID=83558 RepID=A0A0F7WUH8_CHLPN|nr:Putative outer membrane protein CPn_1073/CP_0776/CPj1073/CpB1118 [Chlamydia pneumoniae]
MRRYLFMVLALCLYRAAPLEAVVIKITDAQAVLKFAREKTLVCFNIEDTVVFPKQMVGQSAWLYNRELDLKTTLSQEQAREQAFLEWMGISFLVDYELVSANLRNVLTGLSLKRSWVLGISQRPVHLIKNTLRILRSFNIDFTSCPAICEDGWLSHPTKDTTFDQAMAIEKNILFVGSLKNGQPMDAALEVLLSGISSPPSQIIYVDQDAERLRSIGAFCKKANIYFIGMLYTPAKQRVESYNPKLTAIQWSQIRKNLSDEYYESLLSYVKSKG